MNYDLIIKQNKHRFNLVSSGLNVYDVINDTIIFIPTQVLKNSSNPQIIQTYDLIKNYDFLQKVLILDGDIKRVYIID